MVNILDIQCMYFHAVITSPYTSVLVAESALSTLDPITFTCTRDSQETELCWGTASTNTLFLTDVASHELENQGVAFIVKQPKEMQCICH